MGLKDLYLSVQGRLPNASVVRSVMLILLMLLLLLIVSVIKLSRHQHRFWVNKPVAFASVLPIPAGVITHRDDDDDTPATGESAHNDTLPDEYEIRHIKSASAIATNPAYTGVLSALWNTRPSGHPTHAYSRLPFACTPQDVSSRLQQPYCELFLLLRQNQLVGTLVCAPTILDTPVENSKHAYIAQQLFVHPEHRGNRLAPCLMNRAIDVARQRHQCEPVVLFSVPWVESIPSQNRLPFAHVSKSMRVYHNYRPSLLLDPETEVSHTRVCAPAELPTRAFESSDSHIAGGATLELSTETQDHAKYWQYVLQQPQHVVLSVGGTDWIHLTHLNQNPPTEASDETRAISDCRVILQGFSFRSNELENIVPHLLMYLQTECKNEPVVTLVVYEPLAALFDAHSQLRNEPQHNEWIVYDAHFIYMYNYKLSEQHVVVPYTMHRDIF